MDLYENSISNYEITNSFLGETSGVIVIHIGNEHDYSSSNPE